MGLRQSKFTRDGQDDTVKSHDDLVNYYKNMFKHFIMTCSEYKLHDNSTHLIYNIYVARGQNNICEMFSETYKADTFRLTDFARTKVMIGQVTPTLLHVNFDPTINSGNYNFSYNLNFGLYRDLNTNIIKSMRFAKDAGISPIKKGAHEHQFIIYNGISDNSEYNCLYNLFDPAYDTVNNVVRL